jgi:hypothetical protein
MRINDLLIESTNQLDEGPKFNKFGKAIGNVAGMAAKGVGAVAGGIAGLGAAAKKGFQAGKSQVAAADDGTPRKPKGFLAGVKAGQSQGLSALNDPSADDEDPTAVGAQVTPAGATTAGGIVQPPPAPAAKPQAGATTPPSATDINKAGPKGTAQAKPIQGTVAKQAAAKTGAALAGQDQAQAGQTMYSQVKANIDKLDKKGKQRILQLLQKSLAAPEAKPAAGGAIGAMAGQLAKGAAPAAGAAPNTMANAPVSKTNTAKPGNPNAAPAAEPAAAAPKKAAPGATTTTPGGEKVLANPVATVGTKRASNIGQPTFDKQTGKALPGQALNAVRKKAEYGTGALGSVRKKLKAGAAQPEMASKINTGSMVLEGFSLFRKK